MSFFPKTAASFLAVPVLAAAMAIPVAARAQSTQVNIPASPLDQALRSFARATHNQILFDKATVVGKRSTPLSGSHTASEGLGILLQGTGLVYQTTPRGAFLIVGSKVSELPLEDKALSQAADTEIVVTGIRATLQQALQIKRASSNIVDSVIADDIGKLPDVTVAEALQRVPGVTVSRDAGEGKNISVRGLGREFNVTTMNGRPISSEDTTRQFNYDILASELVSRVDVNKSPTARLPEGGIGAVIDVRTYRPFELKDNTLIASAFGTYNEKAKKFNPRLAALYSRRFFNDTFGILLSGNYSKDVFTFDQAKTTQYDRNYAYDPQDPAAASFPPGVQYTIPRALSLVRTIEHRKRYGGTVALQWKPSERLEINVDGLYTVYKNKNNSNVFSNILDQSNRYYYEHPTNNTANVDSNGNVLGLSFGASPGARNPYAFVQNESWTFPRNSKTFIVGGNVAYKATDNLKLGVDVSHSLARLQDQNDAYDLKTQTAVTNASYDWSKGILPDLTFSEAPGSLFPSQIAGLTNSGNNVRDSVSDFKFTGEWSGQSFVDSLYFGAGKTTESKRNSYFRTAADDTYYGGQLNGDYYGTGSYGGTGFQFQVQDIGPFHSFTVPNYVFSDNVTNFLPELPGPMIPRNFAAVNINQFLGYLKQLSDYTYAHPLYDRQTSKSAYDLLKATFDPSASYAIREGVTYGYAEGTKTTYIGSVKIRADAGLRVSHTEQRASGYAVAPAFFYANDPYQFAVRGVEYGTPTPVSYKKSYTDVLPSLNLTASITDQLQMRFSAAKVMARADVSDLRPSVDRPNFAAGTLNVGNPNLDPYRATQFDGTVEWYHSKNGALLFNAFYKDLNSFIAHGIQNQTVTLTAPIKCLSANYCVYGFNGVVNGVTPLTTTYRLSGPFNSSGGKIYGLEFSLQEDIGNWVPSLSGLGMIVNATYAKSTTKLKDGFGNPLPIEGLSKFSYNVVGYFERSRFGARVAYNWRNKYLQISGADPVYHGALGWLDASAYVNIGKNLTLNVTGSNLLNSQDKGTYGRGSGPFGGYLNFLGYTGRQYSAGLRAKF